MWTRLEKVSSHANEAAPRKARSVAQGRRCTSTGTEAGVNAVAAPPRGAAGDFVRPVN